jgi:sugar/nucleoside kinase (ribokinase family)
MTSTDPRPASRFLLIGAHIWDTLVRPVDVIPPGQSSVLLEQAAMTPAGTAAGTAVALARLGAIVSTVGVVGDDLIGRLLLDSMASEGIDVSHVRRDPTQPTSVSVLPIRSNGERPALHLPGANAALSLDDIPWDAVAAADHVHLGGLDRLSAPGVSSMRGVLVHARAHGAVTSMDVIGPGTPEVFEQLRDQLPLLDWFLPNDTQALGLTGAVDEDAAGDTLLAAGVGHVVMTRGGKGARLFTEAKRMDCPAIPTEAVDTTGCGDAYTATLIYAFSLGESVESAMELASAAGAIVASGLGSNANLVDFAQVRQLASRFFPRASSPNPSPLEEQTP